MKTIVTLAVFTTLAAAQDPTGTKPGSDSARAANVDVVAAARAGLDHVFADPEFLLFDRPQAAGPLWALGSDFKASFDDAGFTFIGRPRPNAPAVQPIRFALRSVEIDREPLHLAPAPMQHEAKRIVWNHGAVIETVDVAGAGIEQGFTFTSLPQRGEIVVTIGVDTALAGDSDGGGIRFSGAFDDVRYSQAIGIDAVGRRLALPTTWAEGSLEIHVPAAFVASATLPLRIDPWVTSRAVISGPSNVVSPDVAWDETGQVWGVVFSRFFGGTDWDCFVQRVDDSAPSQLVGQLIGVDLSSAPWINARIANLRLFSEFGVVAEVRGSTSAPWQIWNRMIANSGNVVTGQLPVTNTGVDETHPDIGGDPTTEVRPAFFAVVWEHAHSNSDHDILATQLTPLGGVGSVVPVQTDIWNQTYPAISKSNGGGSSISQRWGIVWQQTASPDNEDIYGAMMLWHGGLVQVNGQHIFPIDFSTADDWYPTVSSPTLPASDGSRRLLVTFQRTGVNAGDIAAACLNQDGVVQSSGNLCEVWSDPTRRSWPQYRPAVDSDGDRFLVTYHELYLANTTLNDLDARLLLVGCGAGGLVVEEGVMLRGSGEREFDVRLTSRYSGSGLRSPRACAVNDHDGSSFSLDATIYEDVVLPSFHRRITGCGSLPIAASGGTRIGDVAAFTLTHNGGFAGFIAGVPTSASFAICPACTIGATGATTIGTTFVVAIPLQASLIGFPLAVQGFEIGNSGPCLQSLQLSDTIELYVQ